MPFDISGTFDVQETNPFDSRLVVADIDTVSTTYLYDGLLAYQTGTSSVNSSPPGFYLYNQGTWSPLLSAELATKQDLLTSSTDITVAKCITNQIRSNRLFIFREDFNRGLKISVGNGNVATITLQSQSNSTALDTFNFDNNHITNVASLDLNGTDLDTRLNSIETDYLTIADASATYQTQASMSSYLTMADASSTYQTQAAMSSYLTSTGSDQRYAYKNGAIGEDFVAARLYEGTDWLDNKYALLDGDDTVIARNFLRRIIATTSNRYGIARYNADVSATDRDDTTAVGVNLNDTTPRYISWDSSTAMHDTTVFSLTNGGNRIKVSSAGLYTLSCTIHVRTFETGSNFQRVNPFVHVRINGSEVVEGCFSYVRSLNSGNQGGRHFITTYNLTNVVLDLDQNDYVQIGGIYARTGANEPAYVAKFEDTISGVVYRANSFVTIKRYGF